MIARCLVAAFVFSLVACDMQTDAASCPPTLDSVSEMDRKVHEGTEYILVRRIVGWHDKSEVLELFDTEPKLDECQRNLIQPLIADSLDTTLSVKSMRVDLENKQFLIEYVDGSGKETAESVLTITF
jgi:predicted metal-binding protein